MKKYQVISNISKPSWKRQELRVFDTDYNQSSHFNITINRREPRFSPGDIISVYADQQSGGYGLPLATTYYLNNKLYIDIPTKPKTNEQIQEFMEKFSLFDRISFNIKIVQVLLRHRIIPTFDRHKNLKMFFDIRNAKSK